jgi:hypothetical protein
LASSKFKVGVLAEFCQRYGLVAGRSGVRGGSIKVDYVEAIMHYVSKFPVWMNDHTDDLQRERTANGNQTGRRKRVTEETEIGPNKRKKKAAPLVSELDRRS